MAYAIFKTGGKQYKVAQGEIIEVEKLEVADGGVHSFSEVLMVSDGEAVKLGDALKGATVEAEVVGQIKGDKIICYRYKRRKGYHRTVGHRQKLTKIKITSIPA